MLEDIMVFSMLLITTVMILCLVGSSLFITVHPSPISMIHQAIERACMTPVGRVTVNVRLSHQVEFKGSELIVHSSISERGIREYDPAGILKSIVHEGGKTRMVYSIKFNSLTIVPGEYVLTIFHRLREVEVVPEAIG